MVVVLPKQNVALDGRREDPCTDEVDAEVKREVETNMALEEHSRTSRACGLCRRSRRSRR